MTRGQYCSLLLKRGFLGETLNLAFSQKEFSRNNVIITRAHFQSPVQNIRILHKDSTFIQNECFRNKIMKIEMIQWVELRGQSPLLWLSVATPLVSDGSQPSARARIEGQKGPGILVEINLCFDLILKCFQLLIALNFKFYFARIILIMSHC